MNQITDTIQNIFSDRPLQEDEYRNEADHLIYCAKCNTPRQHHLAVLGKEMLVPVPCRCQQEQRDKEEAERKHREFLDQVSRLKANGLQDKSLREYTFANDKGYNPEMQKAHDYVAHWSEMKAKSIGLLLWGDVGTGKSFFAGCIANALLEQGVPVLMTNFSRILNALSGLYSEEKNQYIDSLNQYSLLIIDDLGIERSTEFALEQVFNVIDSRYRSKLPLIVTTNMTLEELKNPQDLTRSRIYDRVLERCVPLRINNQNIRQRNAAESMKEARRILAGGTEIRRPWCRIVPKLIYSGKTLLHSNNSGTISFKTKHQSNKNLDRIRSERTQL